eukprot:GFUD01008494.1.p1 GENE.GFUD01008494.1~~GFUD01008494.1.p1  ORF type:complete len:132 (+),score=46.66 GFUD01008494.1:164-559(+)
MVRKLTVGLGGRNLPNKDRLSKSDPFLIVFSVGQSGAFKFVKRTEVKKNNLNPDWKDLEFEDGELDLSHKTTILRLEVLDDDGRGKADHLGSAVFTLAQLEVAGKQRSRLQLVDKEKKDAGHLVVNSFTLE